LSKSRKFAVVDLFAGPGGLAEGFSAVRGKDGVRPFQIELSVEKESSAFETLRLRSFLRQFSKGFPREYYDFLNGKITEPKWSSKYPIEWAKACNETRQLELGTETAKLEIDTRINEIKKTYGDNTVLIGGPPCQAYSLVGRARNMGIAGYKASDDPRHFLYREYIRIVENLRPAIFVMENVKGMLSSKVDGERVFDRVLNDLSEIGDDAYLLVPLSPRSRQAQLLPTDTPPAIDFVIRSEEHSVPQARHRVIVVGIRREIAQRFGDKLHSMIKLKSSTQTATVRHVLATMPKLRSGLSKGDDGFGAWQHEVVKAMRDVSKLSVEIGQEELSEFRTKGKELAAALVNRSKVIGRSGGAYAGVKRGCPADLAKWLVDKHLTQFANHETRGHMGADLARYFFASLFGSVTGSSPKAFEFPSELSPKHVNWFSGKFSDRFRVQLWNGPATTVTSHISKDGHYFIHPDPSQCRSLTVREAARLQTFPDNYFFKGNRTEQFVQVGNAVPPYLANKIGKLLSRLLS
jgi:DNA (cytosine-5)-methyltransferase 1